MSKDEFKEVVAEFFAKWQQCHKIDEKQNKELDDLKFWRGIVVGIVIAMFGWIVTNYTHTKSILVIIGIGILVIACIFVIILSSAILTKISEIEKE